jgi:hypothetical protein
MLNLKNLQQQTSYALEGNAGLTVGEPFIP